MNASIRFLSALLLLPSGLALGQTTTPTAGSVSGGLTGMCGLRSPGFHLTSFPRLAGLAFTQKRDVLLSDSLVVSALEGMFDARRLAAFRAIVGGTGVIERSGRYLVAGGVRGRHGGREQAILVLNLDDGGVEAGFFNETGFTLSGLRPGAGMSRPLLAWASSLQVAGANAQRWPGSSAEPALPGKAVKASIGLR